MKWQTSLTDLGIECHGWKVEDATVECDVIDTAGPSGDEVEISGIRVVRLDRVLSPQNDRVFIGTGLWQSRLDCAVLAHLIDTDWDEDPDVLEECREALAEGGNES